MAEDNQFIYAVTCIHMQESKLLNRQDVEKLLAAPCADLFRMLTEKGWGSPETPPGDVEALLQTETQKTWDLVTELVGDVAAFDVFRCANDYHNLKAAIKLSYADVSDAAQTGYYLPFGTVRIESIQKAARERDFANLPPDMAEAGRKAHEVLNNTGNGQLCDMVVDRASLMALDAAGQNVSSELLQCYARITVDMANIKSAVRCLRMRKSREFAELAVAPAGTLDRDALIAAAVSGKDESMAHFLGRTAYADAVPALTESIAAFECWCDNEIIRMIRPCRAQYFGIEPLAAYILGRENEIRMVRLILTVKMSDMHSRMLHERLRETYV